MLLSPSKLQKSTILRVKHESVPHITNINVSPLCIFTAKHLPTMTTWISGVLMYRFHVVVEVRSAGVFLAAYSAFSKSTSMQTLVAVEPRLGSKRFRAVWTGIQLVTRCLIWALRSKCRMKAFHSGTTMQKKQALIPLVRVSPK